MMNREEIIKKIEELKEAEFMLNMKDRWTPNDYKRDRELFRERAELEKMLKNF